MVMVVPDLEAGVILRKLVAEAVVDTVVGPEDIAGVMDHWVVLVAEEVLISMV
jgi:hypothetical protein